MGRKYIFYNDVHYAVNNKLVMTSVRVNEELFKYFKNYYIGSFADFVNSALLDFVQNHCVEEFVYFKYGDGRFSAEKSDIQKLPV